MTKIKLSALAISLLILVSFTLPKDFSEELKRSGMVFEQPEGFTQVKTIENRDMNYEYAIVSADKKMEVRFAIRPLDKMVKDYDDFKEARDKGERKKDMMIDPNQLYSALLQTTLLNISGGNLPDIQEFDSAAVRNEFNADWGATAAVTVTKSFGQKYSKCLVVAIHKNNAGDAYYFYLGTEEDGIDSDTMGKAFHALRFK